jgi:hypothetical protein
MPRNSTKSSAISSLERKTENPRVLVSAGRAGAPSAGASAASSVPAARGATMAERRVRRFQGRTAEGLLYSFSTQVVRFGSEAFFLSIID